LLKVVSVLALAGGAQWSLADCIQDQYGFQYNITYDTAHQSITGTATFAGCPATVWPLTGSYVRKGSLKIQQITAANPDSGPECRTMVMLKGNYPNFAWYYDNGYGGQASKFVACGRAVSEAAPAAGGARGPMR
jgi:hypothetical protein